MKAGLDLLIALAVVTILFLLLYLELDPFSLSLIFISYGIIIGMLFLVYHLELKYYVYHVRQTT